MLDAAEINAVVKQATSAMLKNRAGVLSVESEPALDPDGAEALNITIILRRGIAATMGKDRALDTWVGIVDALQNANEERFPIISYVTEEELDEPDGDPES